MTAAGVPGGLAGLSLAGVGSLAGAGSLSPAGGLALSAGGVCFESQASARTNATTTAEHAFAIEGSLPPAPEYEPTGERLG